MKYFSFKNLIFSFIILIPNILFPQYGTQKVEVTLKEEGAYRNPALILDKSHEQVTNSINSAMNSISQANARANAQAISQANARAMSINQMKIADINASATLNAAEIQAQVGSFGTKEGKLALNIPVVEDKLAVRAAGMYIKSDGYYKNGYQFGPIPGFIDASTAGLSGSGSDERIGGDDVFSGRVKALWEPSDNVSLIATYEMVRDRGDSVPVVNDTPAGAGYAFPNFGFRVKIIKRFLEFITRQLLDNYFLLLQCNHSNAD